MHSSCNLAIFPAQGLQSSCFLLAKDKKGEEEKLYAHGHYPILMASLPVAVGECGAQSSWHC